MEQDIAVAAYKARSSEEKNKVYLQILAILVTMPAFIDTINVVINQFGLGSTSLVTAAVYICVLLYAVCKVRFLALTDLLLLSGLYSLFILTYILFPESREYVFSTEMIIVYVFFMIPGAIAIRKIKSFEGFFELLYPYATAATVSGAMLLMFFRYDEYLVYMDFSYAMLPSVCALYYAFRTRAKRLWPFALFVAGFMEMFIFGARAPLLFLLLFVLAYELMRTDKQLATKTVLTLAGVGIVVLFTVFEDAIIGWLSTNPIFSGSYFLEKISSGNLLESKNRDMITEHCLQRLSTMGMEISGFWGDREYCAGQDYPHNIFLEILMSYGWIFGILAILLLGLLCIKALLKKGVARDAALFLLVALWGRYLISGSYIEEGKFWIGLFALIAIACGKTKVDSAGNNKS